MFTFNFFLSFCFRTLLYVFYCHVFVPLSLLPPALFLQPVYKKKKVTLIILLHVASERGDRRQSDGSYLFMNVACLLWLHKSKQGARGKEAYIETFQTTYNLPPSLPPARLLIIINRNMLYTYIKIYVSSGASKWTRTHIQQLNTSNIKNVKKKSET